MATQQPGDDLTPWPMFITRSFDLSDVATVPGRVTCERCGQDATGRLVDAYAAVFGQSAEVHDDHGHYLEDINRAAFNKAIADWQGSKFPGPINVFYNHGMTLYGTPSELASQPVGHPAAIRADQRGVLTTTHYGRNPFAESVLNDLIEGNVSGHSFTGRIYKSNPERVPRVTRGGELPRVTRLLMGLKEYGPTPMPYYADATKVAVRSSQATGLQSTDQQDSSAHSQPEQGAEGQHLHSGRQSDVARRVAAFRLSRGIRHEPVAGDRGPTGSDSG